MISTADATAAKALPVSNVVSSENWAEPENANAEKNRGTAMPQPAVAAAAPNETPSTNVAAAGPTAARMPSTKRLPRGHRVAALWAA